MADVFVSYKREDAAKVRKLVDALRGDGLDVWWDEDIPPSAPWETTIEKALKAAKVVIVCWSPASIDSENVRSEARTARESGRLIQVFVRPCSPPLFFGERQGVDLSSWRGRASDARIAAISQSIRGIIGTEAPPKSGKAPVSRWSDYRIHAAVVAILLLAGSFAGWWILSSAKAAGPQTLAVLPFRALNSADANLVDAIWDDTRGAISRNPNLRVLGRQAVESLAKKGADPADYRRKIGADFLLDGSVEHVGDQVRMKLSLTRTKDGAEVWSDEIGGRLDDVFAFQSQIASEVEGRVRGRIAPGGGVTAKNISTSGDVYAVYAEARAKMRQRDQDAISQAMGLLHKVVAMDPNYAPGWAELGAARILYWKDHKVDDERRAEAISYLRRALTLAPNLAHAHAALAQALASRPEGEAEARRAVALDPNDAEAWLWLGNRLASQNRLKESLDADRRATEIEPLWASPVGNKIIALLALNDQAGLDAEMRRLQATGDDVLVTKMRALVALQTGYPGEWLQIWLRMLARHPEEKAYFEQRAAQPLLTLGFVNEAGLAAGADPQWIRAYKGILPPPGKLGYERPLQFWLDAANPALCGRLMLKQARVQEYVGYFRAAFGRPDDYAPAFPYTPILIDVTPTVASVLRAGGMGAEAESITKQVEPLLQQSLRNGPATPELLVDLSHYRALHGRGDEAVVLLGRAVAAGWLPDRQFFATDIADEPVYAGLLNRADFQAIRRRIFARIAEERSKVPVPLLAQMFPSRASQAAA